MVAVRNPKTKRSVANLATNTNILGGQSGLLWNMRGGVDNKIELDVMNTGLKYWRN